MNSGGWVRPFDRRLSGESLGQFHANVREVCNEIEAEPESTAAELAETLGMTEDAVDRAVLHLLSDRRILATFGRHKIQTFRLNQNWRTAEPAEVVAATLSLFSASLLKPKE